MVRSWRGWGIVVLGVAVGLGAVSAAEAQAPKGGAAASTAELEEAKRLDAQAEELDDAGKYDAAAPLGQRALAIRAKH
jgi:hypothetical protein